MNYFNKFYSLINFNNRTKEKIADYFTVKENFLFRRDSFKLVALKLPKKYTTNNYNFSDLENIQNCMNININDEGVLDFLSKSNSTSINPVDIFFNTDSLKTLSYGNDNFSFDISSKELSKQISIIQRKINIENIDIDNINICLDPINKKIEIKDLNYVKNIPIKEVKGNPEKINYSFIYFRDLLINSNKFSPWIKFNVYSPYFSRITYDKFAFSVLLHKKVI